MSSNDHRSYVGRRRLYLSPAGARGTFYLWSIKLVNVGVSTEARRAALVVLVVSSDQTDNPTQ